MVTLADLRQALASSLETPAEFICQTALNLYKSPQQESLVTQAAAGRHLRPIAIPQEPEEMLAAIEVCLCEDDYPGWLAIADLPHLQPAPTPYQPTPLTRAAIQARLPAVIDFTQAAMAQPNQYLWGGTIGPNYDCSGLMQTAFAAAGIRLPRDAYQQEAFTQPIALTNLQPGDLIFFGTAERTTHVALYLGQGRYIHSSGKDQGRNGIGLDSISDLTDPVSLTYHQQIKGAGRVMSSYLPAIASP
ncbi:C40 family peptidase [Pseudanabaena sp. FACHB-2040]|uniref:C40 family peptidase n=1 Tax=Pseudanabaena sp. FACHB-2040 TaxID=2692859 RepID=UPI0016853C6E|nr:C40 family peptidase [Pseudanabaena sp. FACHB-2040]MBD2256325.1 C40 family peptidase [Pseudanabaena sp. FACHB-2040]